MNHDIDPKAFFYLGGIPTKGCWVELDELTTWDHIHQCLREALSLPDEHLVDEVLCSDTQGIAKLFVSHDCFDLSEFTTWEAQVDDHIPAQAVEAFFAHFGSGNSVQDFEGAYRGSADTPEDYVQEWFDDIHGEAIKQAEQAGLVIDWEATARAFFQDEHVEVDGFIFIRNW